MLVSAIDDGSNFRLRKSFDDPAVDLLKGCIDEEMLHPDTMQPVVVYAQEDGDTGHLSDALVMHVIAECVTVRLCKYIFRAGHATY